MKLASLQDNLSKVKAVEDLFQQMLRFPGDAQQVAAGEVRKRRELRRKQVVKSEESEAGKLKKRGASPETSEPESRGRPTPDENVEENPRQCSIDFLI